MGLLYMEQIRGYPYMSAKRLAEEFGCTTRTVFRRIEGIRQEIKKGRYNQYAILDGGGNPRVNTYVYIDYEKYWKSLQDRNASKYVPAFEPDKIAEICGFKQKVITQEREEQSNETQTVLPSGILPAVQPLQELPGAEQGLPVH